MKGVKFMIRLLMEIMMFCGNMIKFGTGLSDLRIWERGFCVKELEIGSLELQGNLGDILGHFFSHDDAVEVSR